MPFSRQLPGIASSRLRRTSVNLAHCQLIAIGPLARSFGEDPQAMETVSKLRMRCERGLHEFQVVCAGGDRVGCIGRGIVQDQIEAAKGTIGVYVVYGVGLIAGL